MVLSGQTTSHAMVVLRKEMASGKMQNVAATRTNAQGAYQFKINCGMGTTPFVAQVHDAAGIATSTTLSVTIANQAIVWNSICAPGGSHGSSPGADASRAYAIVAISVYDAVNAVSPQYASYGNVTATVSKGTPADVAAAAAAETALVGLFPQQASMLTAELNATLAAIPGGNGRNLGVALGTSVANQILALRSNDGSNVKVTYVPGTGRIPGFRRPRRTRRRLTLSGAT